MAAPIKPCTVELGFVENTVPYLLRSRFFPSKLGGKPAWLSLKPLPNTDSLTCRVCSKPTIFLMQIYSPVQEQEDAFHRILFIFVCSNPECNKINAADNFRVFRSQLSRTNDFYSSEPPEEKPIENEVDAALHNQICRVCGCVGLKRCAKCQKVNYCSKDHQTIDWKKYHKQECGKSDQDCLTEKLYDCMFPEMELITETEDYTPEQETVEKSEEDKLKEYKDFVKSDKSSELVGNMSEKELQDMACKETENDKQLRKFKKRISLEPDQVLRYQRGGKPLWIASTPKPELIPNCECGAARLFEFQVLPQLLSYMHVDKVGASLDWGTLCVYTCSQNCSVGNNYQEEFIFKQDIV